MASITAVLYVIPKPLRLTNMDAGWGCIVRCVFMVVVYYFLGDVCVFKPAGCGRGSKSHKEWMWLRQPNDDKTNHKTLRIHTENWKCLVISIDYMSQFFICEWVCVCEHVLKYTKIFHLLSSNSICDLLVHPFISALHSSRLSMSLGNFRLDSYIRFLFCFSSDVYTLYICFISTVNKCNIQ